MKLAVSHIAWAPGEDDAAAHMLLTSGARGLEVAPGRLFDDPSAAHEREIAAVRRAWTNRGLEIVALQALLFGRPDLVLFGDRESRDRTAEYLRQITQVAAGLGARAMVFGSPKNRQRGDTPPRVAERIATDFFAALGGYAAEHDVVLCLEANAPGYECDFVCRTEEAVDLVQRVGSPGFRVQIDTSTMAMNSEDYRESIELAAPVAGHLHISEPYLGPVGLDGQVPVGTVLEAVDASNYDSWVSIEMRPAYDGRNLDALQRALNCVTRVREGG